MAATRTTVVTFSGPSSLCRRAIAALLVMTGLVLNLFSPVSAQDAPGENPFPGRFPAPSLDGGVEWLNTSGPIDLKDLRGKIVLLDFWTYCCINCIHVLPDLKYLEEKYNKELVVIGVHAAKFTNEKETENIRRAILRYEIAHPVINDANMIVARKYQFSSWPTLVLIDPEGNFVGQQAGEGSRQLFDEVIGKMVTYHRAKGTLDETPVRFALERNAAPPTPLRFPSKLLADEANDRLYISDSNHNRIVVTTLKGELIEVIGNGSIGAVDGDYATCSFDHPHGMTLANDILYVADTENHLIRTVDLKRKTVETLAGTGQQSRVRVRAGDLKTTALNSPWALTHMNGVLYIAMAGPHQLWSHKIGSGTIELFAGTGREDILDGRREEAALAQPSGITHDGRRLFFVDSEGSAVRLVGTERGAHVSTVVGPRDLPQGRSLFEFGDIDGKGADVRLQHPLGVVYHKDELFVADTYNHKIKRVTLTPRAAETWLGTGKRGTSLDPVEMSEPSDMIIVGDRMIIVDCNNHRLLSVDMNSRRAEELVISGLTPPPAATIQLVEDDIPGAPVVTLPEQVVSSGAPLSITAQFKLPEGYKLNKLAPQTVRLNTGDKIAFIPADQLNTKLEGMFENDQASWTVPISGTGQGTFELTVSYSYCRDGAGGVCKFGTQKWLVPLKVASDARGSKVTVEIDATSK